MLFRPALSETVCSAHVNEHWSLWLTSVVRLKVIAGPAGEGVQKYRPDQLSQMSRTVTGGVASLFHLRVEV